MIDMMVDVMDAQLKRFASTSNPLMEHKPHMGLSFDKMTDTGKVQWQVQHIRVNWEGTPLSIHLNLHPITHDYDENVEAGALSCFNYILEDLEKIGVMMIVEGDTPGRKDVSVYDPANGTRSEQVRSLSSDGEATYRGINTGVVTRFHDPELGELI
jgi:hypothetical protein